MKWPGLLADLLASIFSLLALLHIYWALGGRWGSQVAVPVANGKPLFQPGRIATLAVSIGLILAALIVLGRTGQLAFVPTWLFVWGTWGIAIVFFLRAIGDLRYVGFFKRHQGTDFAAWDTWLFSPLCLGIACLSTILALTA